METDHRAAASTAMLMGLWVRPRTRGERRRDKRGERRTMGAGICTCKHHTSTESGHKEASHRYRHGYHTPAGQIHTQPRWVYPDAHRLARSRCPKTPFSCSASPHLRLHHHPHHRHTLKLHSVQKPKCLQA